MRKSSEQVSRDTYRRQPTVANYSRLSGLLSLSLMVLAPFVVAAVSGQTENEIAKIRAEVAKINKAVPKFQKTIKNVENISLEGTEATYYRSGESVKKIAATMFGETYNAKGDFYYREGELIFAYRKRSQYDTQIGLRKPPKVVRVEEQRFYFANGELIRLLVGKKELKPTGERYSELKDEIINISGKLAAP